MDTNEMKGHASHDRTMGDQPPTPDDADAVDRDPYIVPLPEDDQQHDVPQHFPGEEPAERMLADDGESLATPD